MEKKLRISNMELGNNILITLSQEAAGDPVILRGPFIIKNDTVAKIKDLLASDDRWKISEKGHFYQGSFPDIASAKQALQQNGIIIRKW